MRWLTRSGCSTAVEMPVTPPIEFPISAARSIPTASRNPTSAMTWSRRSRRSACRSLPSPACPRRIRGSFQRAPRCWERSCSSQSRRDRCRAARQPDDRAGLVVVNTERLSLDETTSALGRDLDGGCHECLLLIRGHARFLRAINAMTLADRIPGAWAAVSAGLHCRASRLLVSPDHRNPYGAA